MRVRTKRLGTPCISSSNGEGDREGDNRALASKIAQSVKKKAKWQNAEHYLPGFLPFLSKLRRVSGLWVVLLLCLFVETAAFV